MIQYSGESSELSSSCSNGIHTIAAFDSAAFISLRYDQVEQEKLNVLLLKSAYKNPLDESHLARPLIGFGPEALPVVIRMVIENFDTSKHLSRLPPDSGVSFDSVFELERRSMRSDLPTLLKEHGQLGKLRFLY